MKLRGRTVVLYGDLREMETGAAVRRLQALGARVAGEFTEETDLIFLASGERGPIPRTDAMLRTPYLDEDALIGMLEREEGTAAPAEPAPGPFLTASELAGADGSRGLHALLDGADWSAFTPERDVPPLRSRLAELERAEGVTDAHRLATRRLIGAGVARLLHPYGHDTDIVAHAMSPDGRYLATGSWVGDDHDAGGVLQIWEIATGRCVNTVRRIEGGIGWPRHEGTIQWSADSSRIAMAHSTNIVGVWTFAGEQLATIDVADGQSRPSPFALSPDGRSVYFHCGTNGEGGLQGCVVPLDRGRLRWLPNHVETDHPYLMARRLPQAVRDGFAELEPYDDVKIGQWIDDPVWSPDGTRLFGANAISVDAGTREVVWYAPGKFAGLSPDGRTVAAVTRRGLFLRDASTGRIRCGPFALGKPVSLHWAPRRAGNRLAVLTPPTGTAETGGVHIIDDDRVVFSRRVPHSGWGNEAGDHNAWAWAPDGERAAFLTIDGSAEIWSFTDPANPRPIRSVIAGGADTLYWGADDTLVVLDDVVMQFVKVETGEVVGDFYSLYVPPGPRPVEDELVEEFEGRIFALDEDNWAMTLQPDAVIAPEGREDELDALLAWGIGRRHSWPVRWGELRVLPDALSAADVLDSADGELLREYREELEEDDGAPAEWPPPDTETVDDLFAAARDSLAALDRYSWGPHIADHLRAAARLRARRGEAEAAMVLVGDIPEPADRLAAASDVAVILARAGDAGAARAAFSVAGSLFPSVDRKMLDADRSASFGAACQALGDTGVAEQWFRHARASISTEPNPWQDHVAVMHSMLECGRDDLVRTLLDDRAAHPDNGFFSAEQWVVYLLRTDRLDLAREFQSLPGWDVPYEALTVLAELGRADLLETWGDHDWAIGEELVELARGGTPPVRPAAPTDEDVRELARGHARIQGVPHSQRRRPIELLIESAAECGHVSAVLDLLERLPENGDFNDRPSSAFGALWLLCTGFNRPPF